MTADEIIPIVQAGTAAMRRERAREAELAEVLRRVAAGQLDLRDVNLVLTGRFDQDFPAWLLERAKR